MLIAFVGSVFSPYYAWARRRGPVDPLDHCAFNVALYGARGARWAMTERRAARVVREPGHLGIGPSSMHWDGDAATIHVDELCVPLPRRIRGSIRLMPAALGTRSYLIDSAGRHRWTPYAPHARVEVRLDEPALRWSGNAYLDANSGTEPLEKAFRYWTWSRTSVPEGTVVLYDVVERPAGGETRQPRPPPALALRFARDATARECEPPPLAHLSATGWRVRRQTRADEGGKVRIVRTLEDAPFYSRSLLETRLYGARTAAIHESLDLDRFSSRWVRLLLPFRMPRAPH